MEELVVKSASRKVEQCTCWPIWVIWVKGASLFGLVIQSHQYVGESMEINSIRRLCAKILESSWWDEFSCEGKIDELKKSGVPEKYWAELARLYGGVETEGWIVVSSCRLWLKVSKLPQTFSRLRGSLISWALIHFWYHHRATSCPERISQEEDFHLRGIEECSLSAGFIRIASVFTMGNTVLQKWIRLNSSSYIQIT